MSSFAFALPEAEQEQLPQRLSHNQKFLRGQGVFPGEPIRKARRIRTQGS